METNSFLRPKIHTNVFDTAAFTKYFLKVDVICGKLTCKTTGMVLFKTIAAFKSQVVLKNCLTLHRRCTLLLDVCDLCVADGAGLPLSSEHWVKICHSWKKSDNLGIDTPCFLNNRLHHTWSCAGGDCLGFLTGICSPFSHLIPGMARHFFYYVTKLWYGSYNTTCPPGIDVYS